MPIKRGNSFHSSSMRRRTNTSVPGRYLSIVHLNNILAPSSSLPYCLLPFTLSTLPKITIQHPYCLVKTYTRFLLYVTVIGLSSILSIVKFKIPIIFISIRDSPLNPCQVDYQIFLLSLCF